MLAAERTPPSVRPQLDRSRCEHWDRFVAAVKGAASPVSEERQHVRALQEPCGIALLWVLARVEMRKTRPVRTRQMH